jgi:hypothetical protein
MEVGVTRVWTPCQEALDAHNRNETAIPLRKLPDTDADRNSRKHETPG